MKTFLKIFALVALVSGLTACGHSPTAPDPSPTPTGNLVLTVEVTLDGAPISGATVLLTNSGTVTQTTDNAGKAVFQSLMAGGYSVAVTQTASYKLKAPVNVSLSANQTVTVEVARADKFEITCIQQNGGSCLHAGDTLVYSLNHGGIQGFTMKGMYDLVDYVWPQVPNFGYQMAIGGGVFDEFHIPPSELGNFDRFAFFNPVFHSPGTVDFKAHPVFPCTNAGNQDITQITCRDEISFSFTMRGPTGTSTGTLATTPVYGPFRVIMGS